MNLSLAFNAGMAGAIALSAAAAGFSVERAFKAAPASATPAYIYLHPHPPRSNTDMIRPGREVQPRPATVLPIMPMSTDYLP